MKILFSVLFVFNILFVQAQMPNGCYQKDSTVYIRSHQVHFVKLKLEVSFVPQKAIVKGKVTEYFTPLRKNVDTIFFNGPGIKIISCALNGIPASFNTDSNGICVHCTPTLHWDTQDSITFVYEADAPRKGIYFYGWNDPKNLLRKEIWTQGEHNDNRYWIPMYDEPNDKMLTEMFVTFDKNYEVLSNGSKISEKLNADSTKTWHYTMFHPMSSYLIMLGIGNYAIKSAKSSSGVPMYFWYYPDQQDRVEQTYKQATNMMDFLENETGVKYPWESYSQIPVENYVFGAMENTTATVFGDFYLNDKRGGIDRPYTKTDAHEMTHQWFGDYITCRSWQDYWLHESFATYYSKLFDGEKLHSGEDYYAWNRRSEQNLDIDFSKTNLTPIRNTNSGYTHYYQKGSAVLDMLSYIIGHDAFKRAIHYYLSHNSYKNADAFDFTKAFKDTLGLNLDWFFDEWIFRGGEPAYNVSYKIENRANGKFTVINIKQTQKTSDLVGYFKMPINFEVFYTDGSMDSVQQWISHVEDSVIIPDNKEISFVLFDPGSWILKTISFSKSFKELRNQVKEAPHAIDRYDALVAMRDSSIEIKRDLLISEFARESFHGMREEVVKQLANDKNPQSTDIIKLAFNDKDVGVRKETLNDIDSIGSLWKPYFEKALNDSSYMAEQIALRKLCRQFPSEIPAYLNITKNDYGLDNALRIEWLSIKEHFAKSAADSDSALQNLTDYLSSSYEFRTRMNAMAAIKKINVINFAIVANLFDAAFDNNWHLAAASKEILDYFYGQPDKRKVIQGYYNFQKFTDWQQKIIRKYK